MKIYVLYILNILIILPSFSQDRHLPSYSNTEQIHNIFPEESIHLKRKVFESFEAVNENLKNLSLETSFNKPIADTIPWHKIDLSSPQMKKKSAKRFPWWIVATAGGAAAVTTGVILLLKEDEPINPASPIARNDQFTVPCKMNTAISPLTNDSGEGLRIIAVSGAATGLLSFTDQTISILEPTQQNFSFTYTIIDNNGVQANATVTIIIDFPPIQLQNQSFQGSPGDVITHQIFTNAVCTACAVTSVNAMPQSNFTWTTTGSFNFVIPDVTQQQTILFTFLITDGCMQTGTAQISVTVRPDCDIEPSFIVGNEECDFNDGSIQVVIDPITNYKFQWSTGMNTSLIDGLSEGNYTVTISLISNPSCAEVFEVEVLSEVPAIIMMDERYQTVANVLFTGNVLTNDQGSSLSITNFEDLDVLEFAIQADGSFRFRAPANGEDQYTSIYTVTDICGNTSTATVIFDVAKLPCEFTAIITTSPAACGKTNGSASVSISPGGQPYSIVWPNGTTGPSASGFAPGSYNLVITNTADNCVLNFNFIITENPAPNYIQIIETSPATCIGGGQVDLVLNDPMGSTMQLTVTRGNLPFLSLTVTSGPINLGELANFLPGNYRIFVNCQSCPERCAQFIDITISQVSLLLEINDDVANIQSNEVWNGDVLTNDIGTGMNVVGFTQPAAGAAFIDSDGSATYTAPADFSGTVTFNYTVRDTCGLEKSATVTINIEAVPCDFTVQFSNISADCGMMNGSSTIILTPPGNSYEVIWSNGAQGISNSMLLAGNYTVTISLPIAGCSQMFSTIIPELPPSDLIQQISTNPATCLGGGSMSFTIFNPKPIEIVVEIYLDNQYILSATIPSSGTYSDVIDSLTAGFYLLQALESGSPRRCADPETFEIELIDLTIDVMNDNHTIGFGSAWNGNVLQNDIGTGLRVNGFTQSPNGIVQVLSNGNGTFIPNPGFSGIATFQYFVLDTCNQEGMATVTINVLPNGSDLMKVTLESFQQPLNVENSSALNPIPEGIPIPILIGSPAFQNGFRFSMYVKQWVFRTEISYGESKASNAQNQMLYQNNFLTRIGVGWFHDFNGNRIIAESGLVGIALKSVSSNIMSTFKSRQTLRALYFKSEYQIKLNSGYCIFWEPQILYFPAKGQLTGMLSTGFKFIFE
ncbi:MAG: cadherin-like domain-containing protein [Saprospiraceae bacterium]|nr:cadherin-like domain-containing protein [Saprospiraceae bacterium]